MVRIIATTYENLNFQAMSSPTSNSVCVRSTIKNIEICGAAACEVDE